ncbi:MAG: helix-turn-helix domain-containing protein [Acidimicrobiia bacterium]|nr:helix-turn-helix domain-containing protein [Acidimicrobiia bacterium]
MRWPRTRRAHGGVPTLERPEPGTLSERILAAAPRCVARWGIAKTTLDDVAREAGCSRASIYRAFPGGKDEVLEAAARYEEARFFAELSPELQAPRRRWRTCWSPARPGASRFAAEDPAIRYLLEHEPELILPRLLFDRLGPRTRPGSRCSPAPISSGSSTARRRWRPPSG